MPVMDHNHNPVLGTGGTSKARIGGMALGVALGILTTWCLDQFAGIQVPAEPAAAIGAVWTFVVDWLNPAS